MSIRGILFHYLLKYRHFLKGKFRADQIDETTDLSLLRKESDEAARKLVKKWDGISYQQADFQDFYGEWVKADGSPSEKVVLYFHGGGFVMGSAVSHRNIVGNFVNMLGRNALVFDYRLAPENPAPAAVNDSVRIYEWLLEQGYRPGNVVFAGDSAGGGIAMGTLLKLKDEGKPLPAALLAFSPCLDMTLSGDSIITKAEADPCTPKGANETFTRYYVGKGDPKHPYTSPLFGNLSGLPPMMIQVGENETLLDDAVRFARKAEEAGVEMYLKVTKGMFHCFPLLAPMFPEATNALKESCDFVVERMDR